MRSHPEIGQGSLSFNPLEFALHDPPGSENIAAMKNALQAVGVIAVAVPVSYLVLRLWMWMLSFDKKSDLQTIFRSKGSGSK